MSCTFSNFNCLQESYARKIGIESILNTWVRRIIGGIISTNLKVYIAAIFYSMKHV